MTMIDTAKGIVDQHLRVEEGERLEPYLCSSGVPTIGVGATEYLDGRKVSLSDPAITKEQMDRMLSVDIDRYMTAVLRMINGECTANQLAALTICAYNIGITGMAGSTMIRRHKAGDFESAARAFGLWNKYRPRRNAPLETSAGLTARRLREAALYLTPDGSVIERMPQAVEPESKLRASPISQGGAAVAGTGVLSLVSQAGDTLGGLSSPLASAKGFLVDVMGIEPSWIPYLIMVAAGAAVVYWRARQRREGWT